MRRLLRLAARLYPASWRRRYGPEFDALLEDVRPGWPALVDVLFQGLAMQTKTLATIPVLGALAGALAGGIVAVRTPVRFASTATIELQQDGGTRSVEWLRSSVERALDSAGGQRAATTVALTRHSTPAVVRVTYLDGDAARAQRVAQTLATAIASEQSPAAAGIVSAAGLPASPVQPDYAMTVATGGGFGFAAGGLVFLILRRKRR